MTLLLLVLSVARAAPGLGGDEAILEVPVAETTARNRVDLAAGLRAVAAPGALTLSGIPLGLSMGLLDRLSLGIRLEPYDTTGITGVRSGLAASLRYRVMDSGGGLPGVAIQVDVSRVGDGGLVQARGVVSRRLGIFGLTGELGPRWSTADGPGGHAGVGVEVPAGRLFQGVAETSMDVQPLGAFEWAVRGGARGLLGPVGVTIWGGTGGRGGVPWAGGGLSLALASVDVRTADRDEDHVPDLRDQCLYAPEDRDDWQDDDGCADPDNDGDGIADAEDPTPTGEKAVTEGELEYTTDRPRFLLSVPETQPPSPDAASVRRARRRAPEVAP